MYHITTPKTLIGQTIGRKRIIIPCFDGSIKYDRALRIYAPLLATDGGGLELQQKLIQSKTKEC